MIYIEDETGKLTAELEQVIINVINSVLDLEEYDSDGEINVLIVTNDEIHRLNFEHRSVDRPTDVLSFPMEDDEILGDLVISLQKAIEQSEEYGHSLEREIGFLSAHGTLHLLGYDHMTPGEEKEMFGKQEQVLGELGLTR